MGKATRWLKGLFGVKEKKEHHDNLGSLAPHKKEKKRRSFTNSGKDHEVTHISPNGVRASESDDARLRAYVAEQESEQNKHAIAVAAATAAAADAAVAAAHAAIAVVRLTSHGRGTLFSGSRERWAAVKIQSFFRGYLARKALRALKGLVKIQALVRGYLVRKRAAATLHSMQALLRAQVAVHLQRARLSTSSKGSSSLQLQINARKYMQWFDETRSEFHSKGLPTSYESSSFNMNRFDESPKIVEIDTYRPQSRSRRITTTVSESGEDHMHYQAISVLECRNPQNLEWYLNADECKFSTAHSTPRLANAPATPLKSVCGDPSLRPHCNSPNYMANTQSYKAKLRPHSAPKQRPDPKKRISLNEIMAARNSTSGIRRPWSSKPESQEYCSFDKVGYSGQLENQKENFRRK